MSNKKQYLNLLSLYYVEGMRNILISSINSLFVVFFLYFTGLHGFSLFIPFIVGSWTVFYIICSYKSGQVSVVDNYFYFQGDLTELFILLNKCGFSLVSELSGYYTLTANNFSTVCPNILNLLNYMASNQIADYANSHCSSFILEPVTKDLYYPYFLIETYVGDNSYINISLNVVDPYLGAYAATFTNSDIVSSEIINIEPNKPFKGKAIALLDLTNAKTT